MRKLRFIHLLLALVFASLWLAAAAHADRIYWSGYGSSTPQISYSNLNASSGADIDTTGATVSEPYGVAIDAAAGKVYWANDSGNAISVADLNGGAAHDINTGAATVNNPEGLGLDPIAGRVYWANAGGDKISFANLNGSGGANLDTGVAAVSNPIGIGIDRAANKIYWSNGGVVKGISFANLDGSGGGGNLNTAGAIVSHPTAVAIDPSAGRVYWTEGLPGSRISFARLDGSGGGGDLNLTGAAPNSPIGIAIDPAAGKLYFSNYGANKLAFANLDNSGGGALVTTGGTLDGPATPALLEVPSPAGRPQVSGAANLSCSEAFAPDLLGAFLFRAPQSIGFQWSRNGSEIPGATADSLAAGSAGIYRCRVTAENAAGASVQISDPFAKFRIGKLKRNKRTGIATLSIEVPSAGQLVLTGKGVVKQRTARRLARARARAVSKAGTVKLKIKAKGKTKRKLAKKGKVKVNLALSFTPADGPATSQTKTVKLIKR